LTRAHENLLSFPMTKARQAFKFRSGAFLLAVILELGRWSGAVARRPPAAGWAHERRRTPTHLSLGSFGLGPFGPTRSGLAAYEPWSPRKSARIARPDSTRFRGASGFVAERPRTGWQDSWDLATLARMTRLLAIAPAVRRIEPPRLPAVPSRLFARPSKLGRELRRQGHPAAPHGPGRLSRDGGRGPSAGPGLRADRRLLTIFSGYRSPAYDAPLRSCSTLAQASPARRVRRTERLGDGPLSGAAPGFGQTRPMTPIALHSLGGHRLPVAVANARSLRIRQYPFEPALGVDGESPLRRAHPLIGR